MGKLRFFMCLGLVVVALSCAKGLDGLPSEEDDGLPFEGIDGLPSEEGMVELTVSAATSRTRAADTSFDEEVTSLQVFLFSSDGKLESVAYSESDNVSLRTFTGEKSLYVVANHSEIGWTLETKASDLQYIPAELSDERWNVMVGSCEVYVDETSSASGSPISVKVEVKRIAARIGIHKITNATTDDSDFEETTINITGVYVTNVVGNACLSAAFSDYSYELTTWYNMMGNTWDLPDILYNNTKASIKPGKTEDIGQYFYCYPNPTEDDCNFSLIEGWQARFTRLVVEVNYGSVTGSYYYVVSFDGVSSGHSYEITELTLEQRGAVSPEGLTSHVHKGRNDDGDGDGNTEKDPGERIPAPGDDDMVINPTSMYGDSSINPISMDEGESVVHFQGGQAKVKVCDL